MNALRTPPIRQSRREPPVRVRASDENLFQLVETLCALHIGIEAFRNGKRAGWMIVSAYLHQMLTDTSRGNSPLATRVIPALHLHPLRKPVPKAGVEYLMCSPVSIAWSEGHCQLEPLFGLDEKRIPLDDWLTQPAFVQHHDGAGHVIYLREVITAPRDQAGGVHFDASVDRNTALVEGLFSFIQGPENRPTFRDYLVAMGEYVHAEITGQLMGYLGNGYVSVKDYDEARQFYEEALAICRREGNLQGICEQLTHFGYFCGLIGNHSATVEVCTEALAISRRIRDADRERALLNNLYVACFGLGNQSYNSGIYSEAVARYQEAIRLARELADLLGELYALVNLGLAYNASGDFRNAIATWAIPLACELPGSDADEARGFITEIGEQLASVRQRRPGFDGVLSAVLGQASIAFNEATCQEYTPRHDSTDALWAEIIEAIGEHERKS
ncbi:MAG: tetratricopeptide repeat protein [Chloroflexi bacterium]|nr:tetratricopeptide repeat protein [Chloroflexota bacterium]